MSMNNRFLDIHELMTMMLDKSKLDFGTSNTCETHVKEVTCTSLNTLVSDIHALRTLSPRNVLIWLA